MKRHANRMSRHPSPGPILSSPRNLRLGTLVLVFVGISQIYDPLVDPTIGQELWYWSARIAVLAVGLWLADVLVTRYLPDRWTRPAWLRPVVLVTAFGLLPFALAELLMEPHLPLRPEYADDELWAYSPMLAYLSEYATAVSIVAPVHLLLWLIVERPGRAVDASPAGGVPEVHDASSTPAFLLRSAVARAEDVLAFRAEEHYVRIYTRGGQELVHYRFGDAVQEMPEQLGLRVHRSWWVAGDAVLSAKRGARRWQLSLESDIEVPVSDSYVQAVRAQGWLLRKRSG